MVGTGRKLLIAAVLLAGATEPVAHAQDGMQLPAPLPAPAGLEPAQPPAPAADLNPPAAWPPLPGAWPPADYRLPPVDESELPPKATDSLLDPRQLPPPGWYAYVEKGAIGPHLENRLFGSVAVSPTRTDTVHVPGANLNWAFSPRFEVGYRVPQGFGEFLISYRFLVSQGSGSVMSDLGTANLHSRLDVNVFDFDYANRHILTPRGGLEMRWRVGIEAAGVFFDSQATGLNPAAVGGVGPVAQGMSNNNVGAGPHAGVELWQRLGSPRLALYGELEGSSLYTHQDTVFAETFAAGAGGPLSVATRTPGTQGVSMLGAQLGLSWTPPIALRTHLLLGYQYRTWEQLGRNSNTGSDGSLKEQGIFLRGEFSF